MLPVTILSDELLSLALTIWISLGDHYSLPTLQSLLLFKTTPSPLELHHGVIAEVEIFGVEYRAVGIAESENPATMAACASNRVSEIERDQARYAKGARIGLEGLESFDSLAKCRAFGTGTGLECGSGEG